MEILGVIYFDSTVWRPLLVQVAMDTDLPTRVAVSAKLEHLEATLNTWYYFTPTTSSVIPYQHSVRNAI